MEERCNEINERFLEINPVAKKDKLDKNYDYNKEILRELEKIPNSGYNKIRYIYLIIIIS